MKYLKFNVIILSLVILLPVRTFAIDLPKDLPTIEALMCGLPLTRGSTMYIPIWYWQEPFLPPPTRFICW